MLCKVCRYENPTCPFAGEQHRWVQWWKDAANANRHARGGRADELLEDLYEQWVMRAATPVRTLAEAAALVVRGALPYSFDGRQRILSFERARARGFGACGDASAAIAAAVAMADRIRRFAPMTLCYEQPATAPEDYAHVALDVEGFRADPYPEQSRPASSCAHAVDVRELLGWHAPAVNVVLPPSGGPHF